MTYTGSCVRRQKSATQQRFDCTRTSIVYVSGDGMYPYVYFLNQRFHCDIIKTLLVAQLVTKVSMGDRRS